MPARSSNVVDFARYRAARATGQLDLLAATVQEPGREMPLPEIRQLSPGQVAHRARMLRHLTSGAKAGIAESAPIPAPAC
jgi:hypothetical protein